MRAYRDAGGGKGAPGVGAVDAVGAEARLGVPHVAGGVDGLHGRQDAKPRDPRNVVRVHDLRVLDAQPQLTGLARRAEGRVSGRAA